MEGLRDVASSVVGLFTIESGSGLGVSIRV
jgi:hypothetical protein